ncbi:partner of Y14 and mago-like [Salvia miltiorrhiza]|uniref:partner of Y14 and mago-like n=1 Tax=Salvia miltiorrhiza TaxID=226208 RepID=UPI0025ACE629|nr:partner of Y14 and mago-like [Salvia miltiorrhiza]
MNGGGAEDAAELHHQTLKEGERILGPTRRPDGTLRKPIRIRPGYTPPDEVPKYQSKGSMWKKEMSTMQEVPPGYDPVAEPKPKSKSAKRNERKKEKRQQAALNKDKDSDQDDDLSANSNDLPENVESTSSKMSSLSVSESALAVAPPTDSNSEDQVQDIDKKIRALKKKIRLTEAQQQKTQEAYMKQEQLEKLSKLEGWRSELKLLEDKKSQLRASIS